MINKPDRILGKVKSNYWLITHKYVLRVPKYIVDVKQINDKYSNKLWMDSTKIKMKYIIVDVWVKINSH